MATATPGVDATLAAAAASIDLAAAPAAPDAPPGGAVSTAAAPIDWRREAFDFWQILALLSMRFPRLEPVFSDENVNKLADAWAPVLKRHGLHAGILGIYFAAGITTLPLAVEATKAIRLDLKDEKAADAAAAAAGAATAMPVAGPAAAAATSAAAPDVNQLHKRA